MWTLTEGKTVTLHLHSGRLLNTLHRRGRITLDSMILKHFICWADIANFENILRMTAFKGCASVVKWLPRVREAPGSIPTVPTPNENKQQSTQSLFEGLYVKAYKRQENSQHKQVYRIFCNMIIISILKRWYLHTKFIVKNF